MGFGSFRSHLHQCGEQLEVNAGLAADEPSLPHIHRQHQQG
jgi:hypothetical protein